jgi:hypothetical protein
MGTENIEVSGADNIIGTAVLAVILYGFRGVR